MKTTNLFLLILALLCLLPGCRSISEEKEQWLIEQAAEGDLYARYYIVRNTDNMLFRKLDKQTKEQYAQSLLENEYPQYLYYKAQHATDTLERIQRLEHAAQKGYVSAMYDLYRIYTKEKYRNDTKADKWLREAAAEGHKKAREKVREIDGIKVSQLTLWKEKAMDAFDDYSGTFLARIASMMTSTFGGLLMASLVMIFTGTWIGLLILLALVGIIALFLFLINKFVNAGKSKSIPHWIVWVYMIWGILVGIFGQSTSDVSYNIGRLWLAEGTFGFGAKAAIYSSWAVFLCTAYAILISLKDGNIKEGSKRALYLMLVCIVAFLFGSFLSIIAAILSAFFLYRTVNEVSNIGTLLKNDAEKNDSLTSEENEYKYQINGKQAKDIGVVPGHRFEDEQGGIWEKGEDGKFYKQD